jgi:hypothetical protein
MSRGLGKLQRDLLETLEQSDKSIDTITLAAIAYQVEPDAPTIMDRDLVTDAHHAAVRRALRNLHKRGLVVDLMRHDSNGRRQWASPKVGLPIRLRYLQNGLECCVINAAFGDDTRAEVEAKMTEIATIQERMKELGLAPTR